MLLLLQECLEYIEQQKRFMETLTVVTIVAKRKYERLHSKLTNQILDLMYGLHYDRASDTLQTGCSHKMNDKIQANKGAMKKVHLTKDAIEGFKDEKNGTDIYITPSNEREDSNTRSCNLFDRQGATYSECGLKGNANDVHQKYTESKTKSAADVSEIKTAHANQDNRVAKPAMKYKDITCSKCGLKFSYLHDLIQHVLLHKEENSNKHEEHKSQSDSGIRARSEETLFKCKLCEMNFASESQIKEHIMQFHPMKETQESGINEEKIPENRLLKPQVLMTNVDKPFKCPTCGKKFAHKSRLKRHMSVHTGEKPFQCTLCEKKFSDLSNMKRHIRLHAEKKPFECKICRKKFLRKSYFKAHELLHSRENLHKNELCEENLLQKNNSKEHMSVNTSENPFKCEVCKKEFAKKSYLKEHMMIHSGKRPFSCETCTQKISRKSQLQYHMVVHTGEKPYKCIVCGKRFSYMSGMKWHSRIHSEKKPFTCEVCGISYVRKRSLEQHMLKHAGEKVISM